MKRLKLILLFSVLATCNLMALPYSTARREALFLTDKMAYELNLTHDQYDYVYQVNLDYFLHVNSSHDCTGIYWNYRNIDLGYILNDWQYTIFKVTAYFFTPIKWLHSAWHHGIYDHYRHGFHYFKKPKCYHSYRGGDWHHRQAHAQSPYFHHKSKPAIGMRDRYHKDGHKADKHRPSTHRPANRPDKDRPSVGNRNERPKNERPSNDRPQRQRPQVAPNHGTPQRNNSKADRPQRRTTSQPASRGNTDRSNGGRSFGR